MTICYEDTKQRSYSRKYPHVFVVRNFNAQELITWLDENVGVPSEDYILWGIRHKPRDPGYVYLKKEMDAMAFKLRWV
jgi:hypothetical protein